MKEEAEKSAERIDRARRTRQVLQSMRPNYAEVLQLQLQLQLAGLTGPDIAGAISTSKDAAHKRLLRAHQECERLCSEPPPIDYDTMDKAVNGD